MYLFYRPFFFFFSKILWVLTLHFRFMYENVFFITRSNLFIAYIQRDIDTKIAKYYVSAVGERFPCSNDEWTTVKYTNIDTRRRAMIVMAALFLRGKQLFFHRRWNRRVLITVFPFSIFVRRDLRVQFIPVVMEIQNSKPGRAVQYAISTASCTSTRKTARQRKLCSSNNKCSDTGYILCARSGNDFRKPTRKRGFFFFSNTIHRKIIAFFR